MKPIFLIGYMGSGKTTLGRVLSRQLDYDFIDLDLFIENRYHKSIKELFAEHGDNGFREIERRILREVCDFENTIIACGGGTPCFFDNMELMNTHGLTVYLHIPIERLFKRLTKPSAKAKRPVIANKSDDELMDFIRKNLEAREMHYKKAVIYFDTTNIETAAETEVTAAHLKNAINKYLEKEDGK